MAVAVKNVPETTPGQSLNRLAVGSLLGTLYVVASLALLFYVIPSLWAAALSDVLIRTAGGAVDKALLILVLAAVAVGLGVYGLRQVGSKAPHGMRAGICVGLGFLILVGMLTQWVGRIFENLIYRFHLFGEAGPLVGMMATGIIGLALLAWGVRLFFRPNFEKWLIRVEDLGWFTTSAYKRSQGQRVRRGTILAVLVLAGCGIYTLLAHHSLENGPKDWQANIPFTGKVTVTDEGDLALLGETGLKTSEWVQITDPGDSSFSKQQIVRRADNEAEVNRLIAEKRKPPTVAGPVISRFNFQELNDRLAHAQMGRIADPGKSSFKKGEVVPKERFDAEVTRLVDAGKTPPTPAPLRPATGTTEYQKMTLLPDVRFSLPILLAALALWMGYRLVNFPPFADFLIATEAELNKVSWTTRKRLVQDTIVVLTTILLVTIFLFTVDICWVWILERPWIQVLQTGSGSVDTAAIDAKIEALNRDLEAAKDDKDTDRQMRIMEEIDRLQKQKEGAGREVDW